MKKLNNKGFAVASILYSIMVLFLMLLLSILGILGSRKAILDKNKKEILAFLNATKNGIETTNTLGMCSIRMTIYESWTQNRAITVTKRGEGTLQYKVVSNASGAVEIPEWTNCSDDGCPIINVNWETTMSKPTYVYCQVTDGENTTNVTNGSKTYIETRVDITAPELAIGSASSTTNSITIPITLNRDNLSGIKSTVCEITSPTDTNARINKVGDNCEITNAKDSTTYSYKVTTTNGAGMTTVKTGSKATTELGNCTIDINEVKWAQNKTATITKNGLGTLQYKVISNAENAEQVTEWTDCEGESCPIVNINWAANSTQPTYIYCQVADDVNATDSDRGSKTHTETKVDISAPEVEPTFTIAKTTNSIIVVVTGGSDKEAPVKYYQYSKDGGRTWEPEIPQTEVAYEFNNLSHGVEYEIGVRELNETYDTQPEENKINNKNSTVTIERVTTDILGGCSIAITNKGVWAPNKTVNITKEGLGQLQYKVVSNAGGAEEVSEWTNCEGESCSSINIDWAANNDVPTYLYCQVTDTVNTTDASNGSKTYTETKVDVSEPELVIGEVTSTTNTITIPIITNRDNESGIVTTACEIVSPTNTEAVIEKVDNSCIIRNAKDNVTYNYRVVTTNGAGVASVRTNNQDTIQLGGCSITLANNGKWAQSKIATIEKTGTKAGELQYKVISSDENANQVTEWTNCEGNSCPEVNIDWAANNEKATYLYCQVTDNINTTDASNGSKTHTETKVDITAPGVPTFTTTKTTNSITVTVAGGIDNESPIYYQYSKDGGENWEPAVPQAEKTYTFDKLKDEQEYTIKVRVINETYEVNGINDINATESEGEGTKVTTNKLEGSCTITLTNVGVWTQSKTATITMSDSNGILQYRVRNGEEEKVGWEDYEGAYTINYASTTSKPTIIQCRITDRTNSIESASNVTETKVDPSAPTVATATKGTVTSKSIEVIASGTDTESDIVRYAFSKDDGSTWTEWQESNTYTFNDLSYGTNGIYNIKVKVYNETYGSEGATEELGAKESDTTPMTLVKIPTPTYTVTPNGYVLEKTLTINYPSGYTNEYSLDKGNTWIPYTNQLTINGERSVVARVTDGINTVTASSQEITKIVKIIYFDPVAGSICDNYTTANSATGTKKGCLKWYLYDENSDGTVDMILDHNTTATVAFNSTYNSSVMKEIGTELTNLVNTEKWSVTPRLIGAQEIATITARSAFNQDTANYAYAYTFDNQSSFYWLFDYTSSCTNYGCKVADSSNQGYWTSTAVKGSTIDVWHVTYQGGLDYYNNGAISNLYGLRPVITINRKLVTDRQYSYRNSAYTFTVPKTGTYKIELWGASGAGIYGTGGKGGYTSGTIHLEKSENLFIYIGNNPTYTSGFCLSSNPNASFNGSQNGSCVGGGGATDVRLVNGNWDDATSLKSRIMVAAGGGGAYYDGTGGAAGGLKGNAGRGNSSSSTGAGSDGATQTSGSAFGIAGTSTTTGGGGYYGGIRGSAANAGGGSSYISGYLGSVAITSASDLNPRLDSNGVQCADNPTDIVCSYHYSNKIFTNTVMKAGNESMPTYDGNSNMTGNSGNGYAKITYIES